ncbi:MAG: hypothetical protein ABH854_05635 [Candidatus Diapherotrites archaeon]
MIAMGKIAKTTKKIVKATGGALRTTGRGLREVSFVKVGTIVSGAACIATTIYLGGLAYKANKIISPKVVKPTIAKYGLPHQTNWNSVVRLYKSAVSKGAAYKDLLVLETNRVLLTKWTKKPADAIAAPLMAKEAIKEAAANLEKAGFKPPKAKGGK